MLSKKTNWHLNKFLLREIRNPMWCISILGGLPTFITKILENGQKKKKGIFFRDSMKKYSVTNAHFESNYSSYYSNLSLIRTSIVATIVLLEINGGSEHRCSSRLSGCLL